MNYRKAFNEINKQVDNEILEIADIVGKDKALVMKFEILGVGVLDDYYLEEMFWDKDAEEVAFFTSEDDDNVVYWHQYDLDTKIDILDYLKTIIDNKPKKEVVKFTIENREYEPYQLSNKQIRDLLNKEDLTLIEREVLMNKVLERFTYDLCPKAGETEDEVFARFFSNYVNKCPNDFDKAVSKMACDHRYLQNEMFKVFMAYVKKLATAFKNGNYDPRNQYACTTSSLILNGLDKEGWPY